MTTAANALQAAPPKTDEGLFYVGMGVFALLFSVGAFGPSIVHPAHRLGSVTPLVELHGTVMFAWILLFIAQSILARQRRLTLHRQLGMCSTVLAAAHILLGYEMTVALGRRGYDLAGDIAGARSDALGAMAFPLLDLAMFAALFVAAVVYRRRSSIHKRLMLLAITGALMPAPIAHFLGHYELLRDKAFLTPAIIALFLAAGAIHDRLTLGRVHPAALWPAVGIFLVEIAYAAFVVPSVPWHTFARWLVH